MTTQYRCQNQRRRAEIRSRPSAGLNGIDYLEVSADQRTLTVYFIHDFSLSTLTPANIVIEGGVRTKGIRATSAAATGKVLTVEVNTEGDFSTYVFRLVKSPNEDSPPDGFDRQLAAVPFSFKVECPTDFDCRTVPECPPEQLSEPELNYLAKDYASFRQLMLDRLSVLIPNRRERNPADLQIALVELLAYVGDRLSYYQDAVATEAYLGTAHQRTSVRRHARLLDYAMHDGCNARAWVCFEVNGGNPVTLPVSTPLLTRRTAGIPVIDQADFGIVLRQEQPEIFETLHRVELRSQHNRIHFYTWSDTNCCLPKGATRATLLNEPELSLKKGDVLVFEEVLSPTTGTAADADSTRRHPVRLTRATPTTDALYDPPIPVLEIEWDVADALPFSLCLSATTANSTVLPHVSVARGNVVLADHGLTLGTSLPPVPEQSSYRPQLPAGPITQQGRVKFNPVSAKWVAVDPQAPASSAFQWQMANVYPCVELMQGEGWTPRRDLLRSNRFAKDFVVEVASDGTASLRFGDGVLGQQPASGVVFNATYRVGNGTAGNVGAGAIASIVSKIPEGPSEEARSRLAEGFQRISRVWNPMSAAGGTDPESLEQVKAFAPYAFRTQERAVTEADWAEVAQRQPQVQRAAGTLRWTGSWHTAFVTVDRVGGQPVDADFEATLRRDLERYRIAAYDLEVNAPVFVPLDLQLQVCVKPGYFRSNVRQALLKVFSDRTLPDGRQGFFHPDRFTFGQPLYVSQLYRVGMAVDGVESLEITRLQRWGKAANRELEQGLLKTGRLEVIRLDNDPNFLENGRLDITLYGGQ